MPVLEKDGKFILYVHVPKTGGTSIEEFFQNNGFRIYWIDGGGPRSLLPVLRCSPQHMHAETLTKIFNPGSFSYVFMTVRNPFDRLRSEYKMRKKHSNVSLDFEPWLESTLRDYVRNNYIWDNHIRPQKEFLLQDARIFRCEEGFGGAWVAQLEAELGTEFKTKDVGWRLRGDETETIAVSDAARALIRSFYKADFDAFGYD